MALAACGGAAPEVPQHAPPAAMFVTLDGSLDGWWSAADGELQLENFEFESAVLGAGPAAHMIWPAWAPSAALAGLWAGASPEQLGRTHAADAGSLRPRRVAPSVPEQFAAAGWRTWIAPGSDDLALWPPSWLGFEAGLAPGERPVSAWPEVLAREWRADSSGFLAAVVLPLGELEPLAGDRAAAWRAWSAGKEAPVALFDAGEIAGLARGDADVWRAVRQRAARRRGRPEALAFEALEQGARLMAADRWLCRLEGSLAHEGSLTHDNVELWVTPVGSLEEELAEPRVPLFLGAEAKAPDPWPAVLGPNQVVQLPVELGVRVGVAVTLPEPSARERIWGADPNRPYRRSGAEWLPVPDPLDSTALDFPSLPEWTAGWMLTWPERVPPGELRVKLQAAEGGGLQGWAIAEGDGSWRATRASSPDRAEWRFSAEQAPLWLAVALERRGAPVILELSLDGVRVPDELLAFGGEPLERVGLPRLLDPRAEPSADLESFRFVQLTSRPSGAELVLPSGVEVLGARRWPPGSLTWGLPIDSASSRFLEWRSPGRPALAVHSEEAFLQASAFLLDRCLDRGERAAWVLWPVEPFAGQPSQTDAVPDFASVGDGFGPEATAASDAPQARSTTSTLHPTRWDLRPLGAPFASDAGLWSRAVTPALWEQRQRELRRAPGR